MTRAEVSCTQSSQPLLGLEKHLLQQQVKVEAWFRQQWKKTPPLFYCSVDLRNSGYKLAPVDTNLFPAGFNNLNPEYMALYVQSVQATIAEICPDVTRLLIIPEVHTRNAYYLENVATLQQIFHQAGFDVRIGWLDSQLKSPQELLTITQKKIKIEPLIRKDDQVGVENFFPCCVVLNNDLSSGIPKILQNLSQTILPPMQMGWSTRLKSTHFRFYQQVVQEFSEELNFDPWIISPFFDQCPDVNFMKKEGENCLVKRAQSLFQQIANKYKEYGIQHAPFVAIKADQGTYGMAVMMIKDPQELTQLNRKQRTNMSVLKGGAPVTKAIIQEGVYTFETIGEDEAVAEPVIYLIGRHVVGGFYRVHKNRGHDENLNSPGMDFRPFPFHEPCNIPNAENNASQRFYIYGIVARLAAIAAAKERR